MTLSPFADSVYAQPGLTHLVRHYDRAPLTGESYLTPDLAGRSVVAQPSPAAVQAEQLSLARSRATGVLNPSTTRAELTSHSDAYVNFFDSTTINRQYTG
jgi:hypothetical protein